MADKIEALVQPILGSSQASEADPLVRIIARISTVLETYQHKVEECSKEQAAVKAQLEEAHKARDAMTKDHEERVAKLDMEMIELRQTLDSTVNQHTEAMARVRAEYELLIEQTRLGSESNAEEHLATLKESLQKEADNRLREAVESAKQSCEEEWSVRLGELEKQRAQERNEWEHGHRAAVESIRGELSQVSPIWELLFVVAFCFCFSVFPLFLTNACT